MEDLAGRRHAGIKVRDDSPVHRVRHLRGVDSGGDYRRRGSQPDPEATTVDGAVSPIPAFSPVTFADLAVAESDRWYRTALTSGNAVALVQHRRLKAFPARLTSSTPQQFSVFYEP
jgi:hypothetical protein